jgi:hypothetical protein
MFGPCTSGGLFFMISESLIVKDVTELIADCIPDAEWERVCHHLVEKIVDNMPSDVMMKLTGKCDAFETAEQLLNAFYIDAPHSELIKDSFRLVGAEQTAYHLDSLNLNTNDEM